MTIEQMLIALTVIAVCVVPLGLLIYAGIRVWRGDADVNEDSL
jgi:hypothetical protein